MCHARASLWINQRRRDNNETNNGAARETFETYCAHPNEARSRGTHANAGGRMVRVCSVRRWRLRTGRSKPNWFAWLTYRNELIILVFLIFKSTVASSRASVTIFNIDLSVNMTVINFQTPTCLHLWSFLTNYVETKFTFLYHSAIMHPNDQ